MLVPADCTSSVIVHRALSMAACCDSDSHVNGCMRPEGRGGHALLVVLCGSVFSQTVLMLLGMS